MKIHNKLLMLLPLITVEALANQYAIQLEASKSPQLEPYQSLSAHGNLFTEATDSGYIRVRLGPYDNKATALNVLNDVHNAGYPNAIITKQGESTATTPVAKTSKSLSGIDNFDVTTLKEWKMLTPEQQQNIVYLDGSLHIKDGNTFTPLSEAIK